jgi:hypothetical protein
VTFTKRAMAERAARPLIDNVVPFFSGPGTWDVLEGRG